MVWIADAGSLVARATNLVISVGGPITGAAILTAGVGGAVVRPIVPMTSSRSGDRAEPLFRRPVLEVQ